MAAGMAAPFTIGLHGSSYGYISTYVAHVQHFHLLTFTLWYSAADEDGYWPKHVLHSGLASSLVPRPSHHLVFDSLHYAKTKG